MKRRFGATEEDVPGLYLWPVKILSSTAGWAAVRGGGRDMGVWGVSKG